MKALILGGCGKMGSRVALDLINSADITRILLADKNPDTARVPEAVLQNRIASIKSLDASGSYPELVKAISDHDVVINCAGPYSLFDPHAVVTAAIEAGVDSIEHGVYLSEEDMILMANRKTVLCATYGVYTAASMLENVPDFMKENCSQAAEHYLGTLAMAHKHGVKVVFGGDTYHADPASEFKGLIKAGFSPEEALQAGTINGAELLGLEDSIGKIEPGKLADLVALRGNPLDNPDALGDVVSVMKEGVVYTPERLT